MLEYKNYVGRIDFDEEAEIFHGEVVNTKDVITFQGTTVQEVKQAFMDSIEDYLAAVQEGVSLNAWITNAIIHQSRLS